MTSQQIQNIDIQNFIKEHLDTPPTQLMLQAKKYAHLPIKAIAEHIQAKQRIKKKLPTWYKNDNILFPPLVSLEQASSETTALWKAQLLKGKTLIDLTGGLGIDSYYFAQYFEKVHYVERQGALVEVAQHNFKILQQNNIICTHQEAAHFLENLSEKVELIYLDPARRDESNRSIAQLQDCEPNILELLPQLLQKSDNVLLKTAPMLDIKLALGQLQNVRKVWVVAVQNDCKEVLYWINNEPQENSQVEIATINFTNHSQEELSATFEQEQTAQANYHHLQKYLYEPNTAVLKAGFFNYTAAHFQLSKLHINSHLYTSDTWEKDFVGRTFEVLEVGKLDKKWLQKVIPSKKANIITRNFPLSVAQICKKINFREGGEYYLIATTNADNQRCAIIAKRLS